MCASDLAYIKVDGSVIVWVGGWVRACVPGWVVCLSVWGFVESLVSF